MTVDPARAAGNVEHAGKTYYFCSQHCMHAFKADSERYLHAAHKPAMSHPAHATVSIGQIGRKAPATHMHASESHGPRHETDPVCGMKVDPAKPAAKTEHQGKTYYFCSQHCAHAFKADPERYLLVIQGAIAGPNGGLVVIRKSAEAQNAARTATAEAARETVR